MNRNLRLIFLMALMCLLSACMEDSNNSGGIETSPGGTGSIELTISGNVSPKGVEASNARSAVTTKSPIISKQVAPQSGFVNRSSLFSGASKSSARASTETVFDLEPASYTVIGDGPDGESFEIEIGNNTSADITSLRFGEWQIKIEVRNTAGMLFAEGSAEVLVSIEQKTNVSIHVTLIEGQGEFDLSIEWPSNIVQEPRVVAYLTQVDTNDKDNLSLTDISTGAENTEKKHLGTLSAGYYSLIVKVYEEENDHLVTGLARTIHILANQTTEISHSLDGVVGVGEISLDVTTDLNEALDVEIINQDTLPSEYTYGDFGGEQTLTAGILNPDSDEDHHIISWYLNGSMVALDEEQYTLNFENYNGTDTAYLPGSYRLDLVAFKQDGSRSGSTSYVFKVIGNATAVSLGSIKGLIGSREENGSVTVLNATISIGNTSITSNGEDGFIFEKVSIGKRALAISAEGYLPIIKMVEIENGQTLDAKTIILKKATVEKISAASGGEVGLSGLSTITFSANSIVDANGQIYEGEVTVSHTAMNPLSDDFIAAFPGDFTGKIASGDVVDIASFGVIGAELTDAQGNPLKLANGQTAEIRIAVTDPSIAPETIPLWHLDKATGQWVEEGSATLNTTTNEYVGEVSHFSYWNFDFIVNGEGSPWIGLTLNVEDASGIAIPNAEVRFTSKSGLSYEFKRKTDHNGQLWTKVPFLKADQASGIEKIQYEIQSILTQGETLTSSEANLVSFNIDHEETYRKQYQYTSVLTDTLPSLSVEAKVHNERFPVKRGGSSLIFNPIDQQSIELRVRNTGNQSNLTVSDISIIPSDSWEISPTLAEEGLILASNDLHKFTVEYQGNDWGNAKADLFIENDSLVGTFTLPLVTVVDNATRYQEILSNQASSQYRGYVQSSLYSQDPYAENPEYTEARYVSSNASFNLYETATYKYRGFSGFDLSNVAKNTVIIGAEIVLKQSYSNPGIYLFQGTQDESLKIEDFDLPCELNTDGIYPCVLAEIEPFTSAYDSQTQEYSEINFPLSGKALDAIQTIMNQNSSDRILKLMWVAKGESGYSYIYTDKMELKLTIMH